MAFYAAKARQIVAIEADPFLVDLILRLLGRIYLKCARLRRGAQEGPQGKVQGGGSRALRAPRDVAPQIRHPRLRPRPKRSTGRITNEP